MIISLLVMGVLIAGIRFSSVFNQIVVAIKLLVVAAVIIFGVAHVKADNYTPFIPKSEPAPEGGGGFMDATLISTLLGVEPAVYGVAGVIAGASIVFFAFIGFDIVATTAEETKNPQRDVPRGILGSLAIVTVLYIGGQPGRHRHAELHRDRPERRRPAGHRVRLGRAWSGWAT